MTITALSPEMIRAYSEYEAEAIIRERYPNKFIEAYESGPNAHGLIYFDVLVWDSESDADNDDGAKAIARFAIAATDEVYS
jgi:hypothetical protein